MNDSIELDIECEDFLKNNRSLYALKARRKKIALIRVDVSNRSSAEVQFLLGASTLCSNGRTYTVEAPTTIIRKFSEFTWDGLLFAILDFHPWLAAVDLCYFAIGPLYNRRLQRQLRQLAGGEVTLKPSEKRRILLGFRRVRHPADQIQLSFRSAGGAERQVELAIDQG